MKTLPISVELLRKIILHFKTMEPSRDFLVDDCLESQVYDELVEFFPEEFFSVKVGKTTHYTLDGMPF